MKWNIENEMKEKKLKAAKLKICGNGNEIESVKKKINNRNNEEMMWK